MKKLLLKKSFLILLTILIWFSNAHSQTDNKILLAADEWSPYNGQPKSEYPGYLVEIAREIFQSHGYEVIYEKTTWNRAIFGTRSGEFDGIIGTGKQETPDFIFPDIEQGIASHTFYVPDTSSWQYSGNSSLKDITLGVIENYSYGSFFNEYIVPHSGNQERVQIITGNDPLLRNLKKIKFGRIEATIEDKNVMQYFLKHNNIDIKIKPAGVVRTEKIYIAFSPDHTKSEKYAKILSQGMKKIRKSGKLNKILAKYGLSEWE